MGFFALYRGGWGSSYCLEEGTGWGHRYGDSKFPIMVHLKNQVDGFHSFLTGVDGPVRFSERTISGRN